MSKRRTFLQRLAALPLWGGAVAEAAQTTPPAPGRDYFAELGVRTFINAAGTFTMLSGSIKKADGTRVLNVDFSVAWKTPAGG